MNLQSLTDDELLRVVDRSNQEVKELGERLQIKIDVLNEFKRSVKELGEELGD